MKVATWNVNGLRARADQYLEWVASAEPDVLCLQEIKAAPSQLPEQVREIAGYRSYWHGAAGGYSGVALQIRDGAFDLEPEFFHPSFDNETRIVEARIGDLSLISVYIPNGGKNFPSKLVFLRELTDYVAAEVQAGRRMILSGDLNIALEERDVHPSQRKPGTIGQRPDERAMLRGLLDAGLVDVCRRLDPDNDRLFTWWPFWRAARERNLGWRLDYILATEGLAATAGSMLIEREFGTSDHAPLSVTFTQ